MTDKLSTQTLQSSSDSEPEQTSSEATEAQPTEKPEAIRPVEKSTTANKRSATAVFALLLALVGLAGVGGLFYWQQQVDNQQSDALIKQLTSLNERSKQQVQQLLNTQQAEIDQHVSAAIGKIQSTSTERINQLEQQLQQLERNQPSDWVLHEVEYLVRVASRTLWLDKDTTTAISLLTSANKRLKALNQAQLLPVRQAIVENIEALKLMPTLDTEDVVLSLMALDKQIPLLQFAMANVPEPSEAEQDLELSNDPADWRENLAKTWQRFAADFITVRRRSGATEPLMSPEHQQNLKENLSLRLQQAQWAASKANGELYLATIEQIQTWLTEYFDLGHLETAQFYQRLQPLKEQVISYQYPSHLSSLTVIQDAIEQQRISPAEPASEQPSELEIKSESTDTATSDNQSEAH